MPIEPNFQTLDIWRKFYITFVWVVTALMLYLVYDLLKKQAGQGTVHVDALVMILYASLPLFAAWITYAVTKRASTQIIVLAVISLFPFLNIINTLLLLGVLKLTKKELEMSATSGENLNE